MMFRSKESKSWRHHVKDWGLILLMVSLITVAVDSYRTQDMPQDNLPPLSGKTLQGEWINVIEQSKQSPVVVYFWATWCGACKFVTPTIDWFDGHYQVVGISAVSGSNQRVGQFMAAKENAFANINDSDGQIMKDWRISATPTIVILKNGQIASTTTGVTTPIGLYARLMML